MRGQNTRADYLVVKTKVASQGTISTFTETRLNSGARLTSSRFPFTPSVEPLELRTADSC